MDTLNPDVIPPQIAAPLIVVALAAWVAVEWWSRR